MRPMKCLVRSADGLPARGLHPSTVTRDNAQCSRLSPRDPKRRSRPVLQGAAASQSLGKALAFAAFAFLGLVLAASVARAREFAVPTPECPTLQAAVDAAAAPEAGEEPQFINVGVSRLDTFSGIAVGAGFGVDKPLVIRPDPTKPELRRVTVAAHFGHEPILAMTNASQVTVQDLDLIRHATNNDDLMRLVTCTNVIVQRCRIGSDWLSVGSRNRRNLLIDGPVAVVVRNCIFFSHLANNFEKAVEASLGSAQNRSLLLYHNLASDYRTYGFDIGAHGDAVVVFRNNVAVNRETTAPEPVACHSGVDPLVILRTSHNTAFASVANVEEAPLGTVSIFGADAPLRIDREVAGNAFREFVWLINPAWDPNPDFFRLVRGGLLNHDATDTGVRVADQHPDARDLAVVDDIEKDARPVTDERRTDRGPDQAVLRAEDLELTLPRIPVFEGSSSGGVFVVRPRPGPVFVGPQDDLPGEMMSGGGFAVRGRFVSIATGLPSPVPPPVTLARSTHYDGTPDACVEFPSRPEYDASVAMTVEAWVFREEVARTETILSHGLERSFWFGFAGPLLRFYRSDGHHADSEKDVQARRWTHVAAAYDGKTVRFYIDGQAAGGALLDHGSVGVDAPLRLGADVTGLPFKGGLDEVRLWSVIRTEQEIRQAMLEEATPRLGLAALVPAGGNWEAVADVPGQAGPGAFGQQFGILPMELHIPRAADIVPMQVDGEVHPDTEYRGAEQVVIRYDDGPDAIAYLVHRDEVGDRNLYVGIAGLRDVPAGRERSNSWVVVAMDPRWSRSDLATPFQLQFRAFLSGDRGQMFNGDRQGGFNYFDWPASSNGVWHVEYGWTPDLSAPTIEFRIPKSEDWLWTPTNGLMIGQFHVAAEGDNFLAPAGVVWNSPATWVKATYVESEVVVPRVRMSGYVYNSDTSHPVAEHRVFLRDDQTAEILATEVTVPSGSFSFYNIPVPPDHVLALVLDGCEQCRYLPPQIATNNIQPTRTLPQTVFFPPAAPGTNRYARVDFFLRRPIGPIALTRFTPVSAAPELILRDEPLKKLPGEVVRIEGTNFHSEIQVFLYDCPDLPPQDRSDCRLGYEIIEVEPTNVVVSTDGTWVDVIVPHVPQESFERRWGWAVKDNWTRLGQVVWNAIGGRFGGDAFRLKLPAYPLVHGFEFDNEGDSGTLQDFDGVFGNNAYICLGAFGECLCRVRDPLYLLYYPIYDLWVTGSGGSCNGMASTSLLFAHQSWVPSSFEEGVHFAAGFTGRAPHDPGDPPLPPKPASYQGAKACVPWQPRNLWAHIRVNHGVQTSAEFIQVCLDQIEGGIFSVGGNPRDALNRVSRDPWLTVLSLVPEVGRGHVVTPYEVIDGVEADGTPNPDYSLIRIYDNNKPEKTNRVVEILPANREHPNGQYSFEHGADDTWRGEGIYVVPLSLWYGERTAPGLLTALEAVVVLVFGDADALYTGADGGQWGWLPDGTLIDNLNGAKSISPLGGGDTSTRNVMLALPTTNPPPTVQINVRSNHYFFHAAHGGRLLQLEQRSGLTGDRDAMSMGYENGRLSSMRFSPQHPATNFTPRIGMALSERERAVFEWSGLPVGAGTAVEFKALSPQRGVEFHNDTGAAVQPTLTLTWVDGASSSFGTNQFDSPGVPPGAVQRLFVHDWPVAAQMRSEIDLNRDGVPDTVEIFFANGVNPSLQLTRQVDDAGGRMLLSWPLIFADAVLETSEEIGAASTWTPVAQTPETVGQAVRVALPMDAPQRFYRLRR